MRRALDQTATPRSLDAVIVGASIAGLFAAECLAREGARVAVVERKPSLGGPTRTWIVTSHIGTVLGQLPHEAILHHTNVMEMSAGTARARISLDPPDLVIERSKLILHLADRATSAGAEILAGRNVADLRFEEGSVIVRAESRTGGGAHELRAGTLVGADGVNSLVAGRLHAGRQNAVPIVQARVQLPPDHDPSVTRVVFDRKRTQYFFWLIPESDTSGVVGLVANTPSEAREAAEDFLRGEGLHALEYQGAMIPLHQIRRRLEWNHGGARALLIGDAAAQVKVTTVGGVVSGLWGAQAAVRSILRGTSYAKELRGLNRELRVHDLIRWSMDRFDQAAYATLLESVNEPLRDLLSKRNRDSIAGAVWRVLAAQPRILALGLRSLIRPHRLEAVDDVHQLRSPSLLRTELAESGD